MKLENFRNVVGSELRTETMEFGVMLPSGMGQDAADARDQIKGRVGMGREWD